MKTIGVNRNPAARKAVGAILRRLREDAGLSQEELADRADIHRTYVGMVERGEKNPTLESLWVILHALGVSWAEFGRELDASPILRKRPKTRSSD